MTYIDEVFTFTDAELAAWTDKIKETVMAHVNVKSNKAPHQGPTALEHLVSKMNLKVDTYTDGTITEVFIGPARDSDTQYGRGVSRRRKGDPRRTEVGHDLALARALRDMADRIEAEYR